MTQNACVGSPKVAARCRSCGRRWHDGIANVASTTHEWGVALTLKLHPVFLNFILYCCFTRLYSTVLEGTPFLRGRIRTNLVRASMPPSLSPILILLRMHMNGESKIPNIFLNPVTTHLDRPFDLNDFRLFVGDDAFEVQFAAQTGAHRRTHGLDTTPLR